VSFRSGRSARGPPLPLVRHGTAIGSASLGDAEFLDAILAAADHLRLDLGGGVPNRRDDLRGNGINDSEH
jgi:hypothetical protein